MDATETRTCQNCKKEFAIEPEDFDFYKKISVPPPTFCPQCRFQRRLAFINFINLHRRKCDLCGKETISKYSQDAPFVVYCVSCWYSDKWDPMEYGREYDFSRPFLKQFKELFHKVPILALDIDPVAAEYSPFSNHAADIKNCYLVFFTGWSEDCLYGFYMNKNRSLLDCSLAMLCNFCYDSQNIFKDNRCFGCYNVIESIECTFCRDCVNCQNCFGSANLRNKKHYIFNQPYSKEEYFKEIKKWDLGSYEVYRDAKRRAEEHWKKFPPRPIFDDFSTNCTGNYVFQSKNCKECYEVVGAENSKYLTMIVKAPARECYDITGWGDNLALSYEAYVGTEVSGAKFAFETHVGNMINGEYFILSSSQDIFGCVSVRQKQYCILNRQYSKEEYENMRMRIIEHMDNMPYTDAAGRTYRYGEFFPIEMSWCPYNESMANLFFPLTKSEAETQGYSWREEKRDNEPRAARKAGDLPDHIKDAGDGITKEAIACSTCPRAYRVIPHELQFLRSLNFPLPRICPFCRIESMMKRWVKNMMLVERTCMKCGARFRTPHTEEDTPGIWCKKCFFGEVA
ncbi:MAG: hypothetical protein HYW65_03890 [Candidatus Liptonbacteria bacterium]|nr:hypothetical protein [Candidatus Liptonbacteria bacterium]